MTRVACATYRLFDAYDQLLYIGRSRHPETRIQVHRRASGGWQLLVVRHEIEWWSSDTAAYRAQQRMTVSDRPLHRDVTCDVTPLQVSVYRIYDERDRLVYVGQAAKPAERVLAHAGRFPCVRWTAEVFPDRASACEAERLAVVNERPLHNRIGGGSPGAQPSAYPAQFEIREVVRQRFSDGELTARGAVEELIRCGWKPWKAFDDIGLKTGWPRPVRSVDGLLALNGLA